MLYAVWCVLYIVRRLCAICCLLFHVIERFVLCSPKIQYKKIASFEQGEALSFFIFPIESKAEDINEKHARILPKFIKNLLKMESKIYPKWGPGGSSEGPWSVWEPFREVMLLPVRFFIDFGIHFGTLLEPCWAQKSLRNQFLVILRAPQN